MTKNGDKNLSDGSDEVADNTPPAPGQEEKLKLENEKLKQENEEQKNELNKLEKENSKRGRRKEIVNQHR